MNQTRVFLIFAWLMVAVLLWMQWSGDKTAAAVPATTTSQTVPAEASAVPPASLPGTGIPQASAEGEAPAVQAAPAASRSIRVVTDVLDLQLNGSVIDRALLLQYPQTKEPGAAPVELFNAQSSHPYKAVTGWASEQGSAVPSLEGFQPEAEQDTLTLAEGADTVSVPFVWTGADGVQIRRTFTFTRGSYAVQVNDEVSNNGAASWQGHVYRRLTVPRCRCRVA